MIKLENNDKMSKAIDRAKAAHPRVKWLGERTYSVSSSDSQRVYTVRFEVTNGSKFAECNCKAGEAGMLCYHVAAAASVNIAVASIRQQAAGKDSSRSLSTPTHSRGGTLAAAASV